MEQENSVIEQYSWSLDQNHQDELIIMKNYIIHKWWWRDNEEGKDYFTNSSVRNSSIFKIAQTVKQISIVGPDGGGLCLDFGEGHTKLMEEIFLRLTNILFSMKD